MFESSPAATLSRHFRTGAAARFLETLPLPLSLDGRTGALFGAKVSILLALYGCGGAAPEIHRGAVAVPRVADRGIVIDRRLAERTTAPEVRRSVPRLPSAATEPLLQAAREVETPTTAKLVALFEGEDYDLREVRRGVDGVPRLLVTRLPEDYADKLRGRKRKAAFLSAVLPLVLEANRQILEDRRRALSIIYDDRPSMVDRDWLAERAARYRVEDGDHQELLRRLDAVPASLALAQAALESGWGTSRFAQDGNALFGQWTWEKGAGIAPSEREGHQKFTIRKFATLYDAVRAYMYNLNVSTHYAVFRDLRAELRRCHAEITGSQLTPTLTRYSIEREAYVRKVDSMIRHNRLHEFDTVQFRGAEESFQQSRL